MIRLLVIIVLATLTLVSISLSIRDGAQQDAQQNMQEEDEGLIKHFTDKWLVIPEWTQPMTINGQLDEAAWKQAPLLDGFRTVFYGKESDAPIEYRVAYDKKHLYIGGEIAGTATKTLARIEIVLQPAAKRDAHYVAVIVVDEDDQSVGTTLWKGDLVENFVNRERVTLNDTRQAIAHADERLVAELAIPLSAIVPEGVQPGDEWLMNILHVHRVHEAPLQSWVPVRNSDHSDRGNGGGIQYRANVVDHGRLGSVFFGQFSAHGLTASDSESTTSDATVTMNATSRLKTRLDYVSITEKELMVTGREMGTEPRDVLLQWKEPDREWQELTYDTYAWSDEAGLALTFQHPQPAKEGMYQLRLIMTADQPARTQVAMLMMEREAIIAAGLHKMDLHLASLAAENIGQPKISVSLKEASGRVRQELELIPDQPGYRYVGLPEMPELYPDALYSLSGDGKRIIAPRTQTSYPNEQFKEDKELITTNAKGETVRIPYYEDADGKRYFISGHLWYLQKNRAVGETSAIAKTDRLGAARLLYRFAQVYEGYNPTVDQAWYYQSIARPAGPPYSYWGGMWYRWYGSDLQSLTPLFHAYTEIKKTDAFEVLSEEVGEDVERKIVEEMFLPSIDYVLTYPTRLGNLSYTNWNGFIEAGKALNEPDYIHRVVERMQEFASYLFLSDGFWQEVTLSYHTELLNGMNTAIGRLKGWSDPEGYISPRTGMRLDNLDMYRDFPIIGKALEMQNKLVYPDGKFYPLQDTHAYMKAPAPVYDAGTFLLPSAGIGRLVGGQGAGQTQVYMHFPPRYKSHYHYDPLHLGLYAQGQELLPDLGYTFNTFYRWYALSTMSHNTVVVDSRNAKVSGDALHGGTIEAFIPDSGLFRAMRASYEASYDAVSEYRREPWFIPFAGAVGDAGATSEELGYVLDLFRVTGGNRHEYTLQGDANRDAYFNTEMALTEYGPYLLPPGTKVVEPVSNNDSGSAEGHYPGYIYVRDVQQAALTDDHYELTLVTEGAGGKEQAKMKVTGLLEAGMNELYLGRSPSLRASRLEGRSKDNNDEAIKYSLPKMVHRRDGTDLRSTFVTVLEPFRGETVKIEAIERLQPDQAVDGAVAVKVMYGATTDILLSNPDYSQHGTPLVIGDIALHGEMGMIRLKGDQIVSVSFVGGTELRSGTYTWQGNGTVEGTIMSTYRMADGDDWDAVVTETSVGPEAIGTYIVVKHPDGSTQGFAIGDVVQKEGKSILILAEQDPGFVIHDDGSSNQVYHPTKHWTGVHTFSIMNIEHRNLND